MMKLLQGLPAYLPRMSPFEMLLILFFVAVFVTVVARPNSTDTSTAGPLCTIVFSKVPIPAGKTIEEKDVIACEFDKLHAWSDATRKLPNVVGHRAKRAIPELAQIRQIDLE